MKKIILSKEQYDLINTIDISEIGKENIIFSDKDYSLYVEEGSIRLLRILITEEIDRNGLTDHQNVVTPYGRKLYELHDTIYSQV